MFYTCNACVECNLGCEVSQTEVHGIKNLYVQLLHLTVRYASFFSFSSAQKPPCEEGIDLAILIDQSLSVSVRRLKDLLTDFFPPFIDLLHVSLEGTYLSVLRFSRFIHFELIFADRAFRTRAAVKSRITSIDSQTYANTRIDRLLNATFDLLDARHGERKDRQNVLAVFTDGKPRPKDEVHPFHNTIIALRVKCSSCY